MILKNNNQDYTEKEENKLLIKRKKLIKKRKYKTGQMHKSKSKYVNILKRGAAIAKLIFKI